MLIFDSVYVAMQPGLSTRAIAMASQLAAHGCKAFKFPPFLNTHNPYSLGYDPRTDLDIGQFEPLHITGSAEELYAACVALNAHGLLVVQDCVDRQYGGPAPMYERGADGKTDKTLFPKTAECFGGNLPAPFDFDNGANDGILANYAALDGYLLRGKIQAGQWLDKVLGIGGHRRDEGKGLPVSVIKAIDKARPGLNYAEVYTGYPAELGRFVTETGMSVLDFTRHFAYRAVSQGASLRMLVGNGYCFRDPSHAFVYVESNDTDGPYGIVSNKLWFYLDALTVPAKAALIYAGDFERYGLAPHLLNLMWIAATFAFGKHAYEFVDDTLIAWSRDGDGGGLGWSGGLFCGFSSDPINHRSEWIHTTFGPHKHLHDYTGHAPDVWTNQDGWGYFTFPPNYFGSAQNYVAYAPAGVDRPIPIVPVEHQGTGNFFNFSSVTVGVSQ